MRHFSFLMYFLLMLPLAACQAEEPEYIAGHHYEVLPEPVATVDPTKVEVAEVFWYGCGHCFSFESKVNPWAKQLPDDVKMVKVPAVWHPVMTMHAKAFYTAKALKVSDKVDHAIFEAMNLRKEKLAEEDEIYALFKQAAGVEHDAFIKVFRSKGIEMAVKRAESKQARYRIQGTPELVVNGKYRVSGRDNEGNDGMLKVASYLVEKERKALKALK